METSQSIGHIQVRTDLPTGTRVVITDGRKNRPHSFEPSGIQVPDTDKANCPFCLEHEDQLTNTIWQYPANGQAEVRVCSNRWPFFQLEGTGGFDESHFDSRITSAFGVSEIGIMTTDHNATPATIGADLFWLANLRGMVDRQRDVALNISRQVGDDIMTVEDTLLWINFGEKSGASQRHLHWQLAGTPFDGALPEINRAIAYYDQHRSNLVSRIIEKGMEDGLVFIDSGHFVAMCPHASFQPFMCRILPKIPVTHMEESETYLAELAGVIDSALKRLSKIFGFTPALNMAWHEAPYSAKANGVYRHFRYWIDIIPAINNPAGFSWATNHRVLINTSFPEEDAAKYKEAP